MRSKLLIYIFPLLAISLLIFGYSTMDSPKNDEAPIGSFVISDNTPIVQPPGSDTATPAGFPYPKVWGWVYAGIPNVNAGTVGACYFKGKYIQNRWNATTLWRFNPDGPGGGPGTIADSNVSYGNGGAIRDMTTAPDGSGNFYLWGGKASTQLFKMDSLGNVLATYTHSGAAYRAITWDPNRKGFWSCNFGDNIVCRDTLGNVIKTITASTYAGKYGLGFDSSSVQDSAFLWVWSQNFTNPSDTTNDLIKFNIQTGQASRVYNFNKGANIAGGAEVFVKDNMVLLALNFQNYGVSAYKLKDLTPPPPQGDTALVLIHDTLATTTQRTSDKDTLYRYLQQYVRFYKVRQFDSTTSLPDLANFKTIIIQETSFDAALKRYLGVTARGQLKTWLASGTAQNKKALIMIGADQGYNYSRSGSGGQDLVLAETYGKFVYRLDNATTGLGSTGIQGVTIDNGNIRALTSSPPGGSYWPDGCGILAGGSSILYQYQNGRVNDSLAVIGNNQAGHVVATMFQDPRYFTGGFGEAFKAVIGWIRSNGGVITGVNNPSLTSLPNDFSLSQNYPNPFNPATKIKYSLPKSGLVTLKVYDILGKEITTLINEVKTAGSYEVVFNGTNLSSGVYFYKLETAGFADTKKMFLLK